MQVIPELLKDVLHDRLKSGIVSRPEVRVEVDRLSFIPGYVEEFTLYDDTLTKTIVETELADDEETVTKDMPITFPLKGLKWSDEGKKFKKTDKFGYSSWRGRNHNGTDIATYGSGSTIVAAWPGKVITASVQNPGAGYYVKIQHDDDLQTLYMHMVEGSLAVSEGDEVEAGDKLGIEGSTGGGSLTGRHLHFETRVGGTAVDSLPYLNGKTVPAIKQTTKGGLTTKDTETIIEDYEVGVPGKVVLNEQMKTTNWRGNKAYTIREGDYKITTKNLNNGYYRSYWKGSKGATNSSSLSFNLNMEKKGYLNVSFSGNLKGNNLEFFQVLINGKSVGKIKTFKGVDQVQTLKDLALPKGNVEVYFILMDDGKNARTFALHSFTAREVDGTETRQKTEEIEIETPIPTPKAAETTEQYVFEEVPVDLQLQTGRFVYQDTLVIPNVMKVDVERDLDAESSEATVTVTNPDGYYSPDFNPYYFPELIRKYGPNSPWSYYVPGKFHVGVLSENTPIRIYMGYGSVQKPERVFTGLIDSTDINGADGTLTIKATDMYKKISNAILMKRKEYGKEPATVTPAATTTSAATTTTTFASMSRRQQIYASAKLGQLEYGLPEESYYILLAICNSETEYGTTGAGRESSGSYILGYGVYDNAPKDTGYAGIQRQMHYGAKRIFDAMRSKAYKLSSKDDATYLWSGGDFKGHQWAKDTNWPSNVWKSYKTIMANKKDYQPPAGLKKLTYKKDGTGLYDWGDTTVTTSSDIATGESDGNYDKPVTGESDKSYPGFENATESTEVKDFKVKKKMIPNLPGKNYRNGRGAYEGVIAHSTAVAEQTAAQLYEYEKKTWDKAFVHFAVDWTEILQYASTDFIAYGAGKNANPRYVHVELCETKDATKFHKSYNHYVWLLAKILRDKKLGVKAKTTLWTHEQIAKDLGGTTHTDPVGYLKTWNVTIDKLVQDVKSCYDNEKYRPYATDGSEGYWIVDPPYPGKSIKEGSKEKANIKKIQKKLTKLGYDAGKADGIFGKNTTAAVKKFQKAKGLTADGIVGTNTWTKLFEKYVEPTPKAPDGTQWLKTAIITDLVQEAGMFGWRAAVDDMRYPDALIQESYYIENNPKKGNFVRALPSETATEEKKFETVPYKDAAIEAPQGWLNPFTEPPIKYFELQHKISDLISDLIKETSYRSYCDRYGTYRLELINLKTPVVATYRSDENIIALSKNIDYSRVRNHLVVYHEGDKTGKEHTFGSFIDKELLLELKGEVRTGVVVVPWAKTNAMKQEVARRLFFDMKRNARTSQISIPGNPALDVLDCIKIIDKNSATSSQFHIKSIKDSFDINAGYIQIIDLTWAAMDQFIQIPGLTMNTEVPEPPKPKKEQTDECILWDKKYYKIGVFNSPTVKKIQTKLKDLGYSPGTIDSDYGGKTAAAVKKFQGFKKLTKDGIVGELTWNAMFCPKGKK